MDLGYHPHADEFEKVLKDFKAPTYEECKRYWEENPDFMQTFDRLTPVLDAKEFPALHNFLTKHS